MKVPFCDLARLTREISPAVLDDWTAQLWRADFIEGESVATLERTLETRLSVPHVVACGNGTDALILGLRALGVGPGGLVAIPALTFWATYEAVIAVGAKALLIDIDADGQLDFDQLRAARAEHSVDAVVLVHLLGWCSSRLAAIRDFCASEAIPLLEDGAQAFGVETEQTRVAAFGIEAGNPVFAKATVGTLSFYPSKVLGGAGDGGAITCQSEAVANDLRSLRNHGRAAMYEHDRVGMNSRLGSLQASYLLRALAASEMVLASRRETVAFYHNALNSKRGLTVHMPPPGVQGNGYLAVVTSTNLYGNELVSALHQRDIGTGRIYPSTIADQAGARDVVAYGDLPASREFCRRVVNLPVFFGITQAEREAVVSAVLDAA